MGTEDEAEASCPASQCGPMNLQKALGDGPPMGSMASMFLPGNLDSYSPRSLPLASSQGQPMPSMQSQYMPNVSGPRTASVVNPPAGSGYILRKNSQGMQHQKRPTEDKTAVKYTGFLPLEGVYEEDTCRIG